ncbi:MAG: PASTA domain-containing protein, partial [Armatimonadota bacterium]
IALVGVYFLARSAFYPGHAPKNVQVPHVRGLTEAEAVRMLGDAGLKVGNITRSFEDEHEPGIVIDQTPDVGTTVATATSVNLTVSKGKKEVEVVDVVGKHIDAAEAALSDAGLRAGSIEERFSDSVPENHVISQKISPEGKIKEGTSVGLVVSKGPEAEEEPEEEEPAETPEDEETQRPPDPVVQITMDESYEAQDPAERRLIVRVTAQGARKDQKIRIIQSDDTALRMEVESRTLGPGETMERPLVIVGNASVEIYHEGNLVYTNTFTVEEPIPTQ